MKVLIADKINFYVCGWSEQDFFITCSYIFPGSYAVCFSNDEQEIFQLTVASFEKLSQTSGHCYTKAVSILENVARVRSCLVMLDLELDELIIEMFQHFLKFIRYELRALSMALAFASQTSHVYMSFSERYRSHCLFHVLFYLPFTIQQTVVPSSIA
jgi:hypothetical protein